ncbi:MAG: hypothetical protein II749_06080 [Clostridia bacterium]|nr:hypothetical protein [Clostridia bacterium]
MDYKTKPTSRKDLRRYSKILRKLFDVPQTGPFPVLWALERVGEVFKNCNYIVVEDKHFPLKTMARCIQNEMGGFTIEIKQSVYDGAYEKKIGAYLGFIMHEICHVFLFSIGFTPVYERSFADKSISPYCSVEWQAKALCGEVMIPYNESRGMSIEKICATYHCSKAFAKIRKKLGRGGESD